MKTLLIGWNVSRVLRLLIGIAALVQGIIEKEGLLIIAGGWILFGVVFNLGCCGSSGCSVPTSALKTKKDASLKQVDTSE